MPIWIILADLENTTVTADFGCHIHVALLVSTGMLIYGHKTATGRDWGKWLTPNQISRRRALNHHIAWKHSSAFLMDFLSLLLVFFSFYLFISISFLVRLLPLLVSSWRWTSHIGMQNYTVLPCVLSVTTYTTNTASMVCAFFLRNVTTFWHFITAVFRRHWPAVSCWSATVITLR